MALSFPTRTGPVEPGHAPIPGHPDRSRPCQCDKPIELDDGSCLTCGRWTHQTVSETWRQRAQIVRRARGGK